LQRECEVLRRRLQAALKSPPVDANGPELVADDASTKAAAGSTADASSKPEAQSAGTALPAERSLQRVISQFESSLFTRRPRERAANHESTEVAAGDATATQGSASHESAASPAPVASHTTQSQPATASSGSPPTPAAPHGHEGESVEAYMQKLLARSRRSATPDAPWTSAAPQPKTLESRGAQPMTDAPQLAAPAHAASLALPEPSHRQDKASVRADLDSLRNVANTAARTAIARYSSRAVREKLLYRSLLATLSLLITVVLLSSSLWGDGSYAAMGWLAAAASLALGVDLARASGKVGLSRIKNATFRSRTMARLVEKTTDDNGDEEPREVKSPS
jgi:chemotaxis protein histidine kinase CheA